MLKRIVFFVFLLAIAGQAFGKELMHLNLSGKKFGVIYDLIEHTGRNELVIASEKGVFTYSGKVLKQIKSREKEVFHKLILSEESIYALSFNDEVFEVNGDSLLLVCKFEVKETVNGFLVNNKEICTSTPHKLLTAFKNGIQKNPVFIEGYNLGLIKGKEANFLLTQQAEQIIFYNLNRKETHAITFNYKIEKVFFNESSNFLIAGHRVYRVIADRQVLEEITVLPQRLAHVKIFEVKKIGEYWIGVGHNNGFSMYNQKSATWTHYFDQISVHAVLNDSFGNIWLGTKFEGLVQIPSLALFEYKVNAALNGKDRVVKSYFNQGKLFLGTNLGNVIVYDLNSDDVKLIPLQNNGEVQAMFLNGNFLYVYCDQLYKIDIAREQVLETVAIHSTKAIYVDEEVYCATAGDFQNISQQLKINKGYWHTCIYVDTLKNRFYVGTKSGIVVLNKATFEVLQNIKSSNQEKVVAIAKVNEELLFYGTRGGVYDTTLKMLAQLSIPSVRGVVLWKEGGQVIYNKTGAIYVAKGQEIKLHFISQMIGEESIISIEKFGKDLLVITAQKIFMINDFDHFIGKNLSANFKLHLETDCALNLDDEVVLSYDNTGIQFKLSTNVDLSFFSEYLMYYQVEGGARTRIEPNQEGEYVLTLEFVPEGKTAITFEVEDFNHSLLDQYKVHVEVEAPFWKSIWFIFLVFSLLIVALLLYQRHRVAKLNVENIAKIKQEQMKTRLVRSELTAIRSQMNPHFVFNTLSTIQLKIAKKETDVAFKLVQKFSSLMRGVLTHSQVEVIALKEEITILKNYIDLEQERFEDSIDIQFFIDETMDLLDYRIPSLITQPIVENSLQHGLRHLEGKKQLVIRVVKKSEGCFVIEIVDNGIGVTAANRINEANNQRKSFAMSAIKKRINYINSLEGLHVSLNVASSSNGTKTQIVVNDYD
ncbi:MAG: histidine kinase [Flavobacteriales bacterium]|jgi:hypothetical protein|nr:histidine kinase [Flavobacteriales bacterium]